MPTFGSHSIAKSDSPQVQSKPSSDAVPTPSSGLFKSPNNKFTTAPLDIIQARKEKDARERQHVINVAIRKAQAKQREIESKKTASSHMVSTPSLATPVYQAPAPTTTGCTTYHSSGALEEIILRESGGNTCATNPGGCFGLLQACPGAPLRAACGGNASCQIQWFIDNKTGGRSWEQIWALWQTQGYW